MGKIGFIEKLLLRCFNHFDITDSAGNLQMRRFYLWRGRRSIYLHKITMSDPDDMHCHPWDFKSLILKGGYMEHFGPYPWTGYDRLPIDKRFKLWRENTERSTCVEYTPGSLVIHRATDAHRLELLDKDKPCWTLVFIGPKIRDWGFYTQTGWMHWEPYIQLKFKGQRYVTEPE